MHKSFVLVVCSFLFVSSVAFAQSPGVLYTFPGNPGSITNWTVTNYDIGHLIAPSITWGSATASGLGGNLVITENGDGSGAGSTPGAVGGTWFITDPTNYPMESGFYAPGSPYEKGNLDVTGLQYIEIDVKNNLPSGTVNVDFSVSTIETENTVIVNPTSTPVGSTLTTVRFPISLLGPRQQTNVKQIAFEPQTHTAQGNLTWTVTEVRTTGTPLAYRDIVTNNAGSPDDGIDGAFPLNTSDMLAIVGNTGSVSQLGFSRNPSGSGSLQWTDKGGTGDIGSESGASIGWGDGSGWRSAQPGSPSSGNSYNERMSDFSNYDRMTVRISALDALNLAGTVGIEGIFEAGDPNGDSAGGPTPPTVLTSQNLLTNGQYFDLVYDLSSVTFLKNVFHWGIDVAPHANDIVFNIDNIRLWRTDYNQNNQWDTPDYVLWRKTPGSYLGNPGGYNTWRAHFGESSPGSGSSLLSSSVPEPSAALLVITAIIGLLLDLRRRTAKVFR